MASERLSPTGRQASNSQKKRTRARSRRQLIFAGAVIVVVLGALMAVALKYGWWGRMLTVMERVDPALTLVLMALLPLAGFSISIVYVLAGMKFGLLGGGAAIVSVTAFHLLGTHWIARSFLRGPMQRFLDRRDYRLPEAPKGAEKSLAAMVALVPGPPYFLRNYALALSGIPLRKYFWVCLGVYTVRSYVTLALGDLGGHPSRAGALWLAGIFAVKLTICAFLIRRIQRQHARLKQKEADAVAA
jgi:uncharacterized membrane protein YdjX (TVP38/TMEM64 family)